MKNEPTFESIAESVWEELTREATAGFPLLSAIPATGVVRFLDYFESRNEAGRERLLHDLALLAAFAIQRRGERPQAWAVDRMRTALDAPGPFTGGWRYSDVRFLANADRIHRVGGRERWLQDCSPQSLQPRTDLLPDPAAMVPAKAALLRKLVKASLTGAGFAPSVFSGGLRFLSPAGILVDCDFGSRMGQLRWQVAAGATRPTHGLIELRWMSYEELWHLRGDWDVLTEENAARSVATLPRLIDRVVATVWPTDGFVPTASASPG